MNLPELSIRRPVFATVLSLVVCLVGLMAYQRLAVREYPNIDEPVISIETTYRGASAEIIESQITIPLEDSLSGIEGIDVMTSKSQPEKSSITIRFRLTRNPDGAAADVRDRVARVRALLPRDIDEPIISKVEADAQPIIYLALSSSRQTALEITDYADRFVKDRLQTLPGVSNVGIYGERRYAMRIWLDRNRLAAYELTPQDVETALRLQNVEVPAGRIEGEKREFTILAETDVRTVAQFNDLIVKQAKGYLVRLKDVGRVEIAARDTRTIVRFNGNSAVAIGVIKQATANPLDVSKALRLELPKILSEVPQGMRIDIAYDSSIFIDRSINNVFHTIGEAVLLVLLVIFFFLRSLRATFIPLVTIPISLIGSFAIMLMLGFSVNTLTLLSMVLAIGLVVDDAIVMLENISRYVERGMHPFQAALKGSKEIAFAVLAMTITLAAVYAPLGFQTGRTGRLFTEFALTLAGAVLVSGFVALSLSPMMSSKLLKHEAKHGLFYRIVENFLVWLNDTYRSVLGRVLVVRPLVVVVMFVVAASAFGLFKLLPSELTPVEDRGVVVSVGFAPEGSTPEYTDVYAKQVEMFLKSNPAIEKYFVVVGFPNVTQLIGFASLKDWSERTIKQQQVVGSLFGPYMSLSGVLVFPVNPASLGQSPIDTPLQFVLLTSAPYPELQKAVNIMMMAARGNPRLITPRSDLELNKPELRLTIDRDKAADIGVDVETIGRTLETMLGGRQVTRFKQNGKQYDVVVQVDGVERTNPTDITNIQVRSRTGVMVQLSNLVLVKETVAPKELNHFNKLRSATISAALAPGYTLGEALAFMQGEFTRLQQAGQLPAGISTDVSGQSRELRDSSGSIYLTFVLALAFIYLVLAAQFESFIDPLIIMLTVPLSMTGALLALYLTGGTLNVYSQIGLVTLVGLITKHGILIVEFANQLQERGLSKRDAVVEASVLRLRPILMTTGAMVLGSVPLALAVGAGAESRQSIGWVIVGGMLVGTFFTLFVVPTAYTLLASKRKADPEKEAAYQAELQAAPAE